VRTDDFDYELPSGRIAQEPVEPRDSCKLLVIDRLSGQIDHRRFFELPEYLDRGDVLVVNETRVLPGRLVGEKEGTGGVAELLLLRERYEDTWECLAKPGRRLAPGAHLVFGGGALRALVLDVIPESGGRLVRLTAPDGRVRDAIRRIGEVPLPPYITRRLEDPELYQTVYAREERSAAAPTAGLHFTPELLERVEASGVRIARIQLDVGVDTFRPVAEDDPHDHHIHSEHIEVSERAASDINEARERGKRVIAVGTTVVRTLESAWDADERAVLPRAGTTELYILPGHRFEAIDAMITNFHTPRSTLLMLVSAFAGRDLVMGAYETALAEGYRFLSFGDAMLIR